MNVAAAAPVADSLEPAGALVRLRRARPNARQSVAALRAAFDAARRTPGLRAVVLEAEGPHFSFGASVEEHLADRCAGMLAALHALILEMLECPVPILVVVRGKCLGGGLEVALAGGPIFATPEAEFGQPEIRLGVFAPAASVLLPTRIGQAAAEELLFTGRSLSGGEARALGLIHQLAWDPLAAALAYFEQHLAAKSAAALGLALRAARASLLRDVRERLVEVERLYLDQLMTTRDANEGLAAFLAKRAPVWEHC